MLRGQFVGSEGEELAVAGAVVDSRNMLHQAGDAVGIRRCPTVPGVRNALARYGFDVAAVHVGLALARPADRERLSSQHEKNDKYRQRVILDGGEPLLGELHQKKSGTVEEKMVDGACCVRIARYVDEIRHGETNVDSIVVLSKDIDLTPAIDYAEKAGVPIFVAALDVVQHRPHPYLLLGPHAYAELVGHENLTTGHELREELVRALYDGGPLEWTVVGSGPEPLLQHSWGLRGIAMEHVNLPPRGRKISLYPVEVDRRENALGTFPLLVCSDRSCSRRSWSVGTVRRRIGPMTIEVTSSGRSRREHFPMGGLVPGDTVLSHDATGRVLGRVDDGRPRAFDPDTPRILRVLTSLPKGGVLVVDTTKRRGLLSTSRDLRSGDRVAAVQVGLNDRGPVWAPVSAPLP